MALGEDWGERIQFGSEELRLYGPATTPMATTTPLRTTQDLGTTTSKCVSVQVQNSRRVDERGRGRCFFVNFGTGFSCCNVVDPSQSPQTSCHLLYHMDSSRQSLYVYVKFLMSKKGPKGSETAAKGVALRQSMVGDYERTKYRIPKIYLACIIMPTGFG